jgi:uncharacterized membrane protein
MLQLAIACLVFLALHVLPSTPLRPALVGALGERVYLGLFSLASLAAIVWMVIAFKAAAPTGLWPALRHLPSAVMPFAFILVVGGVMTPNPTAVGAASALQGAPNGRRTKVPPYCRLTPQCHHEAVSQ